MNTRINYRINLLRITASPTFKEASKEELRTLVALIEFDGKTDDAQELSEAAGISLARCKSALAFWEESGVIREDDGSPSITDEFEERLVRGEIEEVPAVEVAESIRNEDLASMIEECAIQLGQACLSNTEVKDLTALHTQYALSPEYVATLAAYKARKGKTTVKRICDEAIRLSGKGIDNLEALESYIKSVEESSGSEWEIRRVMGIYNRNLSPSERGYFKKWSEDFGYSTAIVTEAYDISVLNTGSGKLSYMDKILTDWHDAGCRTVSECKARSEAEKAKLSNNNQSKKKSKTEAPTPRYGNFDVNEAFMNALERSFKSDDE
jgi:DnaD/phage-associated family protein